MLKPEDLRPLLLSRRQELLAQVHEIERDVRHEDDPLERDPDDQSLQIENDEVLGALDESSREELESIGRALERMDSGEYGICAACGEPIAPIRLRALPTAERCIRCAEKSGR